jgi:hypothetical protein
MHKSRIVLIIDCMSAVAGHEEHFNVFCKHIATEGVQFMTAEKASLEFIANQRT